MHMRRESARPVGVPARRWARLAALPALPLMLAAATAKDDILAERLRTAPTGRLALDVGWFKPLATLPAAAAPLALASAPDDSGRFAKATALANAVQSTALLVWHDGALRLEHYGPGADAATRTQSQSMHKSVLAMMVALALEDGHLASVDAPVSDYLGNWTPQPLGIIRIRHLLEMASGLALPPPGESGRDAFAVRLFHGTDIAAVAREAVQVKPPGAVFEYNNANPQLLLAVLEAATGMAYEDYLARRLWGRIAEAPGGLWMDREGGTPHGYCCLIATARDWLRLGLVLMGEGNVLSKARRDALLAPSAANPAYGQLIWRGSPWRPVRNYRPSGPFGVRHSAPYLADDTFFFDGYGGQRVYVVPSRRLVIVRTGAEIADWDDAALANEVIAALPPEQAR